MERVRNWLSDLNALVGLFSLECRREKGRYSCSRTASKCQQTYNPAERAGVVLKSLHPRIRGRSWVFGRQGVGET